MKDIGKEINKLVKDELSERVNNAKEALLRKVEDYEKKLKQNFPDNNLEQTKAFRKYVLFLTHMQSAYNIIRSYIGAGEELELNPKEGNYFIK